MNARTIISEAIERGISLSLNRGNLALKAAAKPPDDLLDRLRRNKPEIVALLRQAACAIRPPGYADVEWLAAVADAQRLGYPPGKYQQ
jgi:hypothetical protein